MTSTLSDVTVEEMSSLYTTASCEIAAVVIVVYDWLLSLDEEIALVWKPNVRFTCASLVYALSRYLPIVDFVMSIISIYPMPSPSCDTMYWFQLIVELVGQIVPAVFSASRVYALSSRSLLPTIIVFALSLAPFITSVTHAAKWQFAENFPSPFNCSYVDTAPSDIAFRFVIATRVSLITADVLVAIFTWWYTYKSCKLQEGIRFGSSLGRSLLLYGSLYFVVLALLNTLQMVLSALEINRIFTTGSYVDIFLPPLTSILICRFLLNLRQVVRDTASQSMPSFVDAQYRSQERSSGGLPHFIASLGEPVHVSKPDDEPVQDNGDEFNEQIEEVQIPAGA